jgi:hypothetical protein
MTKRIGLLSCCALVFVSLAVFLIGQPVAPVGASTPSTTWVAHSAYGIQVSIPKAWKVTYFAPCPRTETLNIGAADRRAIVQCPNSEGPWVDVFIQRLGAPPSGNPLTVHGLHLYRFGASGSGYANVTWLIPAKNITLIGYGRKALRVMRTLSYATRPRR